MNNILSSLLLALLVVFDDVLGPLADSVGLESPSEDNGQRRDRVCHVHERQIGFGHPRDLHDLPRTGEVRRRDAHASVQRWGDFLQRLLNEGLARVALLCVFALEVGDADKDLLADHLEHLDILGGQLTDRRHALLVDPVDKEARMLQLEEVQRELLLVKSLEHNRAQLDIVIEPKVSFARLVGSDELRISD